MVSGRNGKSCVYMYQGEKVSAIVLPERECVCELMRLTAFTSSLRTARLYSNVYCKFDCFYTKFYYLLKQNREKFLIMLPCNSFQSNCGAVVELKVMEISVHERNWQTDWLKINLRFLCNFHFSKFTKNYIQERFCTSIVSSNWDFDTLVKFLSLIQSICTQLLIDYW